MSTIIDIETGPLSDEELAPYLSELEYTGNAKDPAKIESAMVEKRAEFKERAALSAETGRVLAIGMKFVTGEYYILENKNGYNESEYAILKLFWEKQFPFPFIGHNIKSFDFPFLIRRSWKLGVVPSFTSCGKPWEDDKFIDTMLLWAAGNSGERISLNRLARFFGLPEKNGTGDQFAKWYLGGERDKAIEYLKRDLNLAEEVAKRMGVSL